MDLRKQGVSPHGGNADADQGLAGAQGVHHLAQVPVLVLELAGMVQKDPSPAGHLDVVPVPLEQGHATFFLQFPDGLGDTRLGDVAFFGGPGKAAGIAHRNEVFNLGQFHGTPPFLIITQSLGQ